MLNTATNAVFVMGSGSLFFLRYYFGYVVSLVVSFFCVALCVLLSQENRKLVFNDYILCAS
jgi:uncharacterized membrane protein YgaE (UPF0421/DUF939 family)